MGTTASSRTSSLKQENRPIVWQKVNHKAIRNPLPSKELAVKKQTSRNSRDRFKLTEHHMMSKTSSRAMKQSGLSKENKKHDNHVKIATTQQSRIKQDIVEKKNSHYRQPVGKDVTVKGAQLGKYTEIYLRPCDTGNLEIKEYPPVKVTGIVIIDENRFIVIDEIKKLMTYTADKDGVYGKFGTWIVFKSAPKGVCKLEQNVFIAFSDRTVRQISFEEKLNEENSFFVESKCTGIMAYQKNLAVGMENGKINIVDTKGTSLKKITLPKQHQKHYIPRCLTETPDGNIIFCDTDKNAVLCIKDDGRVIFVYTGMKSPYCATFDPFKNIILIGQSDKSGETIQLLTDKGNKVKVLKYRRELSIQPYYIVNVNDAMKLAICGDSNKIQFYHVEKCKPRTKREYYKLTHETAVDEVFSEDKTD